MATLMNNAFPTQFNSGGALKVVIIYDDFAAGQHAIRTSKSLLDQLSDFEFQTTLWKFAVLRSPKLKEMAAQDAAEADVVIVAAHVRGELPTDIKSLLELWVERKKQGPTALVAMLGGAEGNIEGISQTQHYLQEVANRGHSDYFVRRFEFPEDHGEGAFDGAAVREFGAPLDGILVQEPGHQDGESMSDQPKPPNQKEKRLWLDM